jgi:hypothetical protein
MVDEAQGDYSVDDETDLPQEFEQTNQDEPQVNSEEELKKKIVLYYHQLVSSQ